MGMARRKGRYITVDDEELIEMICLRNEKAIELLYDTYGRMMYYVSLSITGHHEDAEECCNECLYILWKNIPITKPVHLCKYIKTIVYRVSMDKKAYNLAEKRCEFYKVNYEDSKKIYSRNEIDCCMDKMAIINALTEFVSMLSKEKFIIFMERYGSELLIEEIAKKQKVSVSKVKMMLLRMKKELKKYLSEENIFL